MILSASLGVGSKKKFCLKYHQSWKFFSVYRTNGSFSLWKEKAFKKKRFGGEALQRYFTSMHLSSLIACKLSFGSRLQSSDNSKLSTAAAKAEPLNEIKK